MISISNLQTPSTFNRNIKKNSNLQSLKNSRETTFEKEMSKYVEVKNGEYVLNPIIYSQNVSIQDINTLQNMLNRSNKTIRMLHITNLNVENGNTIQIKRNKSNLNKYNIDLYGASGVNNITFFWWGFYLYLDSTNTQALMNASTTFDTTIIAGAISWAVSGGDPIAAIGGSAVAYAIGAALQSYVDDSALCQDGSVISYNYVLGVQQVWAQ